MTPWPIKLHKTLFYLLILLLPTQLGKHFWSDWSLVNGIRVDYLSPTIYLTDIIILGILISWGWEKYYLFKKTSPQPSPFRRGCPLPLFAREGRVSSFFLPLFVFIFFIINCFLSQNQPAAFYKLIKIIEFGLFGFYVAKNMTIDRLLNCSIVAAVIYSSLIAIVQFLKQGSTGGVFYWLGERTFNAGTPGIAQTVWNGQLLLRPYATFSHPNVLAGFLVISLILIIWQRPGFWWFSGILGSIALFLTFSKTALFVYFLFFIFYFFLRKKRQLIGLIIFIIFISSIALPIQQESITLRQDLNSAALKMWQSSPLIGVGLNNFLVRLPEFYRPKGPVYFLQPAHNLFLMILAETGIVGLLIFLWFMILTYKRLLNCCTVKLLIPLTAILVFGLFDHYFYTLQQGQLLLIIILGLCWQDKNKISSC